MIMLLSLCTSHHDLIIERSRVTEPRTYESSGLRSYVTLLPSTPSDEVRRCVSGTKILKQHLAQVLFLVGKTV